MLYFRYFYLLTVCSSVMKSTESSSLVFAAEDEGLIKEIILIAVTSWRYEDGGKSTESDTRSDIENIEERIGGGRGGGGGEGGGGGRRRVIGEGEIYRERWWQVTWEDCGIWRRVISFEMTIHRRRRRQERDLVEDSKSRRMAKIGLCGSSLTWFKSSKKP